MDEKKPEDDDEITEKDRNVMNVSVRAAYLRGMAMRVRSPEDRMWLLRASRSLRVLAALLAALALSCGGTTEPPTGTPNAPEAGSCDTGWPNCRTAWCVAPDGGTVLCER